MTYRARGARGLPERLAAAQALILPHPDDLAAVVMGAEPVTLGRRPGGYDLRVPCIRHHRLDRRLRLAACFTGRCARQPLSTSKCFAGDSVPATAAFAEPSSTQVRSASAADTEPRERN